MVVLNKIYTRTGDDGSTGLVGGQRRPKSDLRVESYGTVDEANCAIGMARVNLDEAAASIDAMLGRIQNDLFDLGADLATPESDKELSYEPLRIVASQVERLESDIDRVNENLQPLRTFVLPGGSAAAAALHNARAVTRRAERLVVELASQENEPVSRDVIRYLNRLSDFLFVAARAINDNGEADVLWVPGQNR